MRPASREEFPVPFDLAAMATIEVPDAERRDFYLYDDELQDFVVSETFEDILSRARKYRLCLVLALN